MNDYDRIARVIRYVDAHQAEQPRLSVLAREAGLSEFHFHRLFSTWAGVTPKSFLQCLTFSQAQGWLREGQSVLEAALGAGLSGAGCTTCACAWRPLLRARSNPAAQVGPSRRDSPPRPLGRGLAAQSPRGVCHLSFVDADRKAAWDNLKGLWPNARWQRDDAAAQRLLAGVFARPGGPEARRPLTALVKGTDFQLRVWRALLRIPFGLVTTYGRLAAAVGAPSAARAVGSAVGSNQLSWLIPCHRVIRQTGAAGEYGWGAVRKKAMLLWEASASVPLNHNHNLNLNPHPPPSMGNSSD